MVEWIKKKSANLKDDILSGITVALALVPEAVAFAFIADIPPVVGLYGAFMVGLITAIFGGRPGMISGATGALAVVMVNLIHEAPNHAPAGMEDAGLQYLFVTLIFMGIIQMLFGVLKLGKLVRLIPHPVMMGFVNGLAIVIFTAQLGMFKKGEDLLEGMPMYLMVGMVGLTMLIMWLLPKVTKKIPAGLAAIVIVTCLAQIPSLKNETIDEDTNVSQSQISTVKSYLVDKTIAKEVRKRKGELEKEQLKVLEGKLAASGDSLALVSYAAGSKPEIKLNNDELVAIKKEAQKQTLHAELPSFSIPFKGHFDHLFKAETLWFILPYAFILAAIGLIESLMTLQLVDEITETKGSGNRESIGQGLANVVNGFFGGMGGCAMIGQSMINVTSGGRGRASGIVAALGLLAIILWLSEWIEIIPIAALVGVMFMVVIGTFAWNSFKVLLKVPFSDALVIVLVTVITVWQDLAIAVISGIVVSALVFSWKNATRIRARKKITEDGTKVYEIWGPLFFGSITAFNEKFDVQGDPTTVEIDFLESKVQDQSGIEAIQGIIERYRKAGKVVTLTHLSPDCQVLLKKANPGIDFNIATNIDDPRYYVMTDEKSFD